MLERALKHAPDAQHAPMMRGVLTSFETAAGTQAAAHASTELNIDMRVRHSVPRHRSRCP